MQNIIIVGTSHIAKESVQNVKKTIKDRKPDIVAVELDIKRYYGLLQKQKPKISIYNLPRVGFKGFLFAFLGSWASKKLGKMVGVEPGDEMKAAIKLAKKNKIKLALIDRDIEVTLSRFSKALTWKEKWQFIKDIFNGIFFKNKQIKKYGLNEFDLSKVPSTVLIEKLMKMMKEKYPSIYMVLVEERNKYMAKKLQEILMKNPDATIVAVVGAGHVKGMHDILSAPSFTFSFDYVGQEDQTTVL